MNSLSSFQSFLEKNTNNFIIRSELVPEVKPQKEPSSNIYYFYVRIFIEQKQNSSDFFGINDIEVAKYELHPSFSNPVRMSNDSRNNFEIKIWTYGFFDAKCKLYFKGGRIQEVTGPIRWKVTEEQRIVNKEELE